MSELNEGIRIKSWQEWRQGISNAKKRIGNFLNPPRETSNEPTVRSGERTPQTAGINQHIPSRDQSGARYDNSDNLNKNKPVVVNKNNNKPVVVNKNDSNSSSSSVQNQIKKNDADKQRLKNNPSKFFGTNQYGEGGSQIKGGPVVKPVSSDIKKQDQQIKKTQPVKTDDYLGKSQGLLGKDAWIHKTRNSPAARSGAFTGDERWNIQLKHRQWQKDNNRGAFRVQKVNTPKIQTQEYEPDAYDLVLEHLISTHQVESVKEAHYVMMEMDADIIKAIVDEAKIDDVKYGTGKGWNQPDKKRIDIYHARHSYLKKNPPNVRSDRNERHSAQDVVFYGHDKVERDRKKKHHASRGVKKERGSKN